MPLLKHILILFFIAGSLASFSQQEDSIILLLENTSIDSLTTQKRQKAFLQSIFDLDQEIRHSATHIEQTFGNSSSEYDSIIKKWKQIDNTLFSLTIDYLDRYLYPKKELGEIPCYTPQLIFHHLSGTAKDIQLKQEYFPMFYQAYLSGAISDDSIYFYLFRLHSQMRNTIYISKLTELAKIDELIEILDLNEK